MTDEMFMPCDDWSEKLAIPKGDLTASDRAALEMHLASCPNCFLTSVDDAMISDLIRGLPAPDFPPGLPPRLLRLREEAEEQESHGCDSSIELQSDPEQLDVKRSRPLQKRRVRGKRKESVSQPGLVPPDAGSCSSDVSQSKKLPPQEEGGSLTGRPVTMPPAWGGFIDRRLRCRDCNATFVFTAGEQEFYASKGLTGTPSRCPGCRARDRTRSRGRVAGICSDCGCEVFLPFQPHSNRPVYCARCRSLRGAQGTMHDHKRKF